MSELLRDAALVCTALGIVSALAVLAGSRDVRLTIAVLLEFLLAASLLRLSADPTVQALATAAIIVALRRLISAALRFSPAAMATRRGMTKTTA